MSQVRMESNAQEVISKLEKLQTLDTVERQQVIMAMAMVHRTEMPERVRRGIATNGGKFESYSTAPMYATKKRGVKKAIGTPWGKFFAGKRRKKFASGERKGKLHRSRYLPGGYAEFRKLIRRSDSSNRLYLTGRMMTNLAIDMYGDSGAVVYFPRAEEDKKARGNEERYRFFFPSAAERNSQLREGQAIIEQIMRDKGFKENA